MSLDPTPVTSRRQLARTLRSLRQQHGFSLQNVHDSTGISISFLSRAERGVRGLGDENISLLCDLYQAPSAVADNLRQLATLSREPSWWDDPALPRASREYIGVEQAATSIRAFGSIVPGLLQTREYAEAVTAATAFESEPAVRDTAVTQRLRRQEVLVRDDPPWVNVVLDECALHRRVGNLVTMREQLRALATAGRRQRTSIQVIPFSIGAHPGMDSRFAILSTSDDRTAELVNVEGLSGYRNLEKAGDIGHYEVAWSALSALALPPEDSLRMIGDLGDPEG